MRALALSSLGLATACGGGGGSSGQPFVFTGNGMVRSDVLFGYYGENASAVTETSAHANLAWCADFYGPMEQMACLTQAKGLGMKSVVMLPAYPAPCTPAPPDALRFWLKRLNDAGLLDTVVAVYPVDEPTCDAAMIHATNAQLREVMAEFPAIAHAKLAVIYACKAGFPGAEAYDVVGCDDYDSGNAVLDRYYGALESAAPRAQLLIVGGGADPWRLDPHILADRANSNSAVWALVGFIWQSADGHGGIRDNGMAGAWCAAGKRLTLAKVACNA
jgi:hypothetical protein